MLTVEETQKEEKMGLSLLLDTRKYLVYQKENMSEDILVESNAVCPYKTRLCLHRRKHQTDSEIQGHL